MSDENQNQEQNEQNQPSEIEQQALDMGWRPKEEFNGDENTFIDAAEFVRRKPLFDKIETQSRELKDVKKALKALEEHHARVKDAEFQHALNELKAQKKDALERGDADRLIELDEQITDTVAERKATELASKQAAQQPHPDFVAWVEKNSWYAQDQEMRSTADALGIAYAQANPGTPPAQVLEYVEGRIRKTFSDKFRNSKRDKPAAVESGSTTTPTRQTEKEFELDDDERKAMNQFVRMGVMTKEKYIEELKRVKGIK